MANVGIYSSANCNSSTPQFAPGMDNKVMYPNASAQYLRDYYPEMWRRGLFLLVDFCFDTEVLAAHYYRGQNVVIGQKEKNLVGSMLGQAAEAWAAKQGWAENKKQFRAWFTRHRDTDLQGPRNPATVTLASFRTLAAAAEQQGFALPARPGHLYAVTTNPQAGSTATGTSSALAGPMTISTPAVAAPFSAAIMFPQPSSSAIGTSSVSAASMVVSAPVAFSATSAAVSMPQQSFSMAMQPQTVANTVGVGLGPAPRTTRHARPILLFRRREPIRQLDDDDEWMTDASKLESVSTAPNWVKQIAVLLDHDSFQLDLHKRRGIDYFSVVKKDGWSGLYNDAETRSISMLPYLDQLAGLSSKWFHHLRTQIQLAKSLDKNSGTHEYHLELKGRMVAINQHILERTVYDSEPQSDRDKHHWICLCFEAIKMMIDLDSDVKAEILRLRQ